MAALIHDRRHGIAHIAFVLLVVAIPLFAGLGWLEHQRNSDLAKLQRLDRHRAAEDDWALYDASINQCRRVNVIRAKQNTVIRTLHKLELAPTVQPGKLTQCFSVIDQPDVPRPSGGFHE